MARPYTLRIRAKWIIRALTPEGWKDAAYFEVTKTAFGTLNGSKCPLQTRVVPATRR